MNYLPAVVEISIVSVFVLKMKVGVTRSLFLLIIRFIIELFFHFAFLDCFDAFRKGLGNEALTDREITKYLIALNQNQVFMESLFCSKI